MAHLQKLRDYIPTLTDQFSKPKNSERKPGSNKTDHVSKPIEIVVDRADKDESSIVMKISKVPGSKGWESTTSQSSQMQINNPDAEVPKSFELHLRKDVPLTVQRCQGNCGKKISKEDFMVVRSYGTSKWTDKNGNEQSRFGPMYIHFERKCLEQFDTEEVYGLLNKFDYSKIRCDEKCLSKLSQAEKDFLLKLGVRLSTL